MPVKTMKRKARNRPPTSQRSTAAIDSRIVNSLTKGPKGGDPVIARNPGGRAADTGSRQRPRTSSVVLPP